MYMIKIIQAPLPAMGPIPYTRNQACLSRAEARAVRGAAKVGS